MKTLNFDTKKQGSGAILEKPIPLHAIFGWLAGEDDAPREPKCDYTPF